MKTNLRPSGETYFPKEAIRDLLVVVVGSLMFVGLKNFLRFEGNRDTFRNCFSGWRESFRVLGEELIAEIDAEAGQ